MIYHLVQSSESKFNKALLFFPGLNAYLLCILPYKKHDADYEVMKKWILL